VEGRREGVGVIKDEEIQFGEIEDSDTLVGAGRYWVCLLEEVKRDLKRTHIEGCRY